MANSSQLIDKFLASQIYSPNTEKQYRYRLLALSRYADEVSTPIHQFSIQQMESAFKHISSNSMIWGSLKKLVESYFTWLSRQGVDTRAGMKSLSEIDIANLASTGTNGYFYNSQELLAKIKSDREYVSKNERIEQEDYRMVSCALLLSWYGLNTDEIIKFKKSDISASNTAILVKESWIKIPIGVFDMLYECATAIGINKNNGYTTVFHRYEDSEFLFRTTVSKRMSLGRLSIILSVFNKKLPNHSEPYNLHKVYYSGVFARAFLKEYEKGGEPKLLTMSDKQIYYEDLFDEKLPEGTLYKRIREYKAYKSRIKI